MSKSTEIVDFAQPFARFGEIYAKAEAAEDTLPDAMSLASVDADGRPSVRMVLLKGWGEDGFVFYTNLESRKGIELKANPNAALCFHWKSIEHQIRIEGKVTPVSAAEADAYFASRPRAARIGAWASRQSQAMASRHDLEKAVARYTIKFGAGPVPRPDFWSGFRLVPDRIEFWKGQRFRLHRRDLFTLAEDRRWRVERLFP